MKGSGWATVSQQENSRRAFISKMASGLIFAIGAGSSPLKWMNSKETVKAVAFDGFAIFDPRTVFSLTEKIFPGKGKEISEIWRVKQFEYSWLRVAADQYSNFKEITADALLFAANKAKVHITDSDKQNLVNAYFSMEPWPDVVTGLELLRKKGIRSGILSNMTNDMLQSCIQHSHLNEYFEIILSTDELKTYKPVPRSYQMGVDAFRLKKSEILFVASAGWDAAGAKWFGYPVYWVNRLDAPPEELGISIERTEKTLDGISSFLQSPSGGS